MSNEVIPWSERLKAEAKDVATLFTPSMGRITLKAGQMAYEGKPVEGNEISVIVIASAFENAFYTEQYNANKPANPDCFALSLSGDGMVPDPIVQPPVNPDCDTCPNLKWGSDPRGGKGKACKEVVRLALLPVSNAQDAESIARSEMASMKLSVTNVKGWGNYVQSLSALSGRPPWSVITTIKVVADSRNQFKVLFTKAADVTDDEILTALSNRVKMAQNAIMTPYDSTGAIEEEASPAAPTKKKKF